MKHQRPSLLRSVYQELSRYLWSLQPEIHGHGVVHIDRIAVVRGGAEAPAAHGVGSRVAEAVGEVLDDLDVVDRAVAADDAAHDDGTLDPGAARHRRVA